MWNTENSRKVALAEGRYMDRAQTHREAEAFFWNGYDPGSASDNRDHDRWSDDP